MKSKFLFLFCFPLVLIVGFVWGRYLGPSSPPIVQSSFRSDKTKKPTTEYTSPLWSDAPLNEADALSSSLSIQKESTLAARRLCAYSSDVIASSCKNGIAAACVTAYQNYHRVGAKYFRHFNSIDAVNHEISSLCEKNDPTACLFVFENSPFIQSQRAKERLLTSCMTGLSQACELIHPHLDVDQRKDVEQKLVPLCDAEDATACSVLFWSGETAIQPMVRQQLMSLCIKENIVACQWQTREVIKTRLSVLCEEGQHTSCLALQNYVEDPDASRATNTLLQLCERGQVEACAPEFLTQLHPTQRARVFERLRDSCKKQDYSSCFILGRSTQMQCGE